MSASATSMIEKMQAIWRALFEGREVGPDADFFMLGGDSLAATVLMLHVEEVFGVMLDPVEVFETPVLSEFTHKVADFTAQAAGQSVEEGVL